MRRLAPRPLGLALDRALRSARPATTLACVQAAWSDAAGPALAAQAQPVAEREGVVTVACASAVWAQEVELLGPEVIARLAGHPALAGAGRVERLRAVVGSAANEN
jgi:predicted nucleic acid-binding Zn ribbon protein